MSSLRVVLVTLFFVGLGGARAEIKIATPEPDGSRNFFILSGGDGPEGENHGKFYTYFAYTAKEWDAVTTPLKKPAASKEEERTNIAQALLIFDRFLAWKSIKAGQQLDKGSWLGNSLTDRGQMNCRNCTYNAYRVLRTLETEKLIKWHGCPEFSDEGMERGGGGWREMVPFSGSGNEHHVAFLYERVAMDGKLDKSKAWIFDRWPYDLVLGKILVIPEDEFLAFRDKNMSAGMKGRVVYLSPEWQKLRMIAPAPIGDAW